MNKIFHLITSIHLGGSEIVAFDLAEHCYKNEESGTAITVVELYDTKNQYALAKKEELISKNIQFITLHKGPKRVSLLFAPFKLMYCMWKEKPSIIHSHTDLPDLVLAATIRLFGLLRKRLPSIVRTIHSTQLWRTHYWMGKITESAYRDEQVVSVSSSTMNAYMQLREKYGLSVSKHRQIIFNGRTIPEKQPHPFLIEKGKINIAFCGRFEDYKGMETIISALPEIGRRFPESFTFHIIGDGTYKKQLEQLSREQPNVFLYAPIPNIPTLLHAFDYLFMPSHFEGLALTSIESSFAGVPVIASRAPGLDETLPHDWPLKFHLNNSDELYNIFEKIHSNKYNRASLIKIAYEFVSQFFSQNKMIQSYRTLYDKMV